MAAGGDRIHRGGKMLIIRQTEIYGIRAHLRKHGIPVRKKRVFREAPLIAHRLQAFALPVDCGDDFHLVLQFRIALHMFHMDHSAADDGYTQLLVFRHIVLPL